MRDAWTPQRQLLHDGSAPRQEGACACLTLAYQRPAQRRASAASQPCATLTQQPPFPAPKRPQIFNVSDVAISPNPAIHGQVRGLPQLRRERPATPPHSPRPSCTCPNPLRPHPLPPAPATQDIWVTLTGSNTKEVTKASLTVTIYYRGWPVQRQTRDICSGARPVKPGCPFE